MAQDSAFAAVTFDGTVIAWGDATAGDAVHEFLSGGSMNHIFWLDRGWILIKRWLVMGGDIQQLSGLWFDCHFLFPKCTAKWLVG